MAARSVALRLDVEIIARKSRLFASPANVCSHVGLVRGLVGAEACVAINPVGTIFCGEPLHGGIESGDAGDQLLDEGGELRLRVTVPRLVGLEPGPVVVEPQLSEKFYNVLHGEPRVVFYKHSDYSSVVMNEAGKRAILEKYWEKLRQVFILLYIRFTRIAAPG